MVQSERRLETTSSLVAVSFFDISSQASLHSFLGSYRIVVGKAGVDLGERACVHLPVFVEKTPVLVEKDYCLACGSHVRSNHRRQVTIFSVRRSLIGEWVLSEMWLEHSNLRRVGNERPQLQYVPLVPHLLGRGDLASAVDRSDAKSPYNGQRQLQWASCSVPGKPRAAAKSGC